MAELGFNISSTTSKTVLGLGTSSAIEFTIQHALWQGKNTFEIAMYLDSEISTEFALTVLKNRQEIKNAFL